MQSLDELGWILAAGLAMTGVQLLGVVFLGLADTTLRRWLPALVAFAAGSLLGGAVFKMLPHAAHSNGSSMPQLQRFVLLGFFLVLATDLVLESLQHRRASPKKVRPVGPLILITDAMHHAFAGLAIGAIFCVDRAAGIAAWLAAAAHELPRAIGDFGILVQAGYSRRRALVLNALSSAPFSIAGVVAWVIRGQLETSALVAIGAGNFLYVATAGLIPEFKQCERIGQVVLRSCAFGLGVLAMALLGTVSLG